MLAAATAPEATPQPRLSDPVPPRAGANPCSAHLARAIPRRPGGAQGGAAVMAAVGNGSGADRDTALVAEALRGNIPGHLRDLQPVSFTGVVGGRQTQDHHLRSRPTTLRSGRTATMCACRSACLRRCAWPMAST